VELTSLRGSTLAGIWTTRQVSSATATNEKETRSCVASSWPSSKTTATPSLCVWKWKTTPSTYKVKYTSTTTTSQLLGTTRMLAAQGRRSYGYKNGVATAADSPSSRCSPSTSTLSGDVAPLTSLLLSSSPISWPRLGGPHYPTPSLL
jgi:hypothetical protein